MSEVIAPSTNAVIDALFFKSGVLSTVTPAPSYELRLVADNTLKASGTLTAVGSAYPYTFNQAAEGLYRLAVTTSDSSADNISFIEEIRVEAGSGGDLTVEAIREEIDTNSSQLARIAAKTDLITADNVTVIAPVDPLSGDLTLVRGDDYTVSSGRALPTWSSDDWTVFDLLHAEAVTFRARTVYSETIFEKAAAVLSANTVRVEFTSAETGDFAVGHKVYTFDLQAVLGSGDVITLAQGHVSIRQDVR